MSEENTELTAETAEPVAEVVANAAAVEPASEAPAAADEAAVATGAAADAAAESATDVVDDAAAVATAAAAEAVTDAAPLEAAVATGAAAEAVADPAPDAEDVAVADAAAVAVPVEASVETIADAEAVTVEEPAEAVTDEAPAAEPAVAETGAGEPVAAETPAAETPAAEAPAVAEPRAVEAPVAAAPAPRPGLPGKPGGAPGRPPVAPVVPVAAPAPAVEAVVAPTVAPTNPAEWGRVDADGAVYLRTADGERKIADWQAGDAEAGLAHFGRRFDDFSTEVALLETRLSTGAGDPKATRAQAVTLRESLADLAALGDFDGVSARLDTVIADADKAIAETAAARTEARAAAVTAKEALCAEAEGLAGSTQWKQAGDRFKTIIDEWRAIRGIDRKTDDALWKRFSKARDTFSRARGSHFAELDKQRVAAQAVKEKLIKQAEALSGSKEWRDTAAAYRDLMNEWKAAGRAPREIEDKLWERFRAAQDAFFSRRNEDAAERDAEFSANAETKEKLLAEAEKIVVGDDLEEAKRALRSVQERWEAAGKVPRERMRELDGRLRVVEDKVRAASEAEWRRTDPEAIARVEQFRTKVEHFKEQAAKARAAGNARKAEEAEQQAATWQGWLEAAEKAVES